MVQSLPAAPAVPAESSSQLDSPVLRDIASTGSAAGHTLGADKIGPPVAWDLSPAQI
jgi:hypothetical protein